MHFLQLLRTQKPFVMSNIGYDVQSLLFEKIKEKLPPYEALVGVITDILNIGIDGAYRRIRGNTLLKLDEVIILCKEFRISIDELLQAADNNTVVFSPSGLENAHMDFEDYLKNMLEIINYIQRKKVKRSFFAAKDIPIFHLFQFPDLAMFKMFFWRNTIFNDPTLSGKRFEIGVRSEKDLRCIDLCRQISEKYSMIPTIEIWNEETAFSFMKQIAYYYKAGLFKNKEDALNICEQVETFFHHLKQETELGYKFLYGHPPKSRVENFDFYFNDLILIDNLITVEFEQGVETFLIYHSIEYLSTSNHEFHQKVTGWLDNLTRKSDLISRVSEMQRNRYFLGIFDRLEQLKKQLS